MPEVALKRIWRVLLLNSREIPKKLGCFLRPEPRVNNPLAKR